MSDREQDIEALVAAARAKLISFPEIAREPRLSIPADEAVGSFDQVTQIYDLAVGMRQAGRCGECAQPFCSTGKSDVEIGCPLGNDIPRWLEQLARGQVEDAVDTAFSTNPAPDWTGAVCPQSDLCEGSCVLQQSNWGAVTIGGVEHLLGSIAWKHNLVPEINPREIRDTSVGIIGTGPAAYATAIYLANLGHQITMYERSPKPGGLLTYGIPNFKLDKGAVTRHFERLERAPNVTINCSMSVGHGGENLPPTNYNYIPFEELVKHHQAIMIATGTYRPKNARLSGNAASEDIPAIDYLTTQNHVGDGRNIPGFEQGHMNAKGKDVVVIGGGDTMVDCVRTAVRQGAKSVKIVYYRGIDQIPATEKDLKQALKEGGDVVEVLDYTRTQTMDRNGDDKFHLRGIKTRSTGILDQWGRPAIEDTDEKVEIDADMVISAVGFDPENLPNLFNIKGMSLRRDGTLNVAPIHNPKPDRPGAGIVGRASLSGEFNTLVVAAGDIVRGPSLVVQALRDGLDTGRFLHDAVRDPARIETKYAVPHVFDLTSG